MKVFPSFLQLHGKTYDYKIPYTSVLRLFLLPHKDQRFMFFVVSIAFDLMNEEKQKGKGMQHRVWLVGEKR